MLRHVRLMDNLHMLHSRTAAVPAAIYRRGPGAELVVDVAAATLNVVLGDRLLQAGAWAAEAAGVSASTHIQSETCHGMGRRRTWAHLHGL